MRVFVGVALPEALKQKIEEALRPFRRMQTPIRWVAGENVHLTLKFIGETADSLYRRLEKALVDSPLPVKSFSAQVRGLGKFPEGKELHVFWAGVKENACWQELAGGIEGRLVDLGIPREVRPFVPHITLGRNKARFQQPAFLELLEKHSAIELGEFPVVAWQIFRSQLTPQGPIYDLLREVPLAAD